MPWAGTLFQWYHSTSLSLFDSSSDFGLATSEGSYSQTFAFSGGYFIFRRPPHQLRVWTNVAVTTELTNSDTTTRLREAVVNDVPLNLTYTPTLFSEGNGGPMKGPAAMGSPTLLGRGDNRTWGVVSGSIRFPTSQQSQGAGRVLSTSLGLGARQQLKLLGSDAAGLTHAVVGLGETWSHHFYKASAIVNSSDLPSWSTPGAETQFFSSGPAIENELTTTVYLVLSLYAGLQLNSSFRYTLQIPLGFKSSPCEVQTISGCVDLPQTGTTNREVTSFELGLSYLIVPELAVDVGYENTAFTLGEDGRTRDPFTSPNALFYAGLTISFDRFYQRFGEPDNLKTTLGRSGEPRPATANF